MSFIVLDDSETNPQPQAAILTAHDQLAQVPGLLEVPLAEGEALLVAAPAGPVPARLPGPRRLGVLQVVEVDGLYARLEGGPGGLGAALLLLLGEDEVAVVLGARGRAGEGCVCAGDLVDRVCGLGCGGGGGGWPWDVVGVLLWWLLLLLLLGLVWVVAQEGAVVGLFYNLWYLFLV